MPAREQRLADYINVWGRRRIILRGGNRGVEADLAGSFPLSYGDLKSICLIGSGRVDGCLCGKYNLNTGRTQTFNLSTTSIPGTPTAVAV